MNSREPRRFRRTLALSSRRVGVTLTIGALFVGLFSFLSPQAYASLGNPVINAPSGGATVNSGTFSAEINVSYDPSSETCAYSYDTEGAQDNSGTGWTQINCGNNGTDIPPPSGDGSHTLYVGTWDGSSFGGDAPTTASVVFTYDNTPPTVSISSPTEYQQILQSAWSGATVSWGDSSSCYYSYNAFTSTSTATCGDNGSDIAAPTVGSTTLSVRGIDEAGNIGNASVDFALTDTPPTISITSPASGGSVDSGTGEVSINWGSADTCEYSFGDPNNLTAATCADNGSDIGLPGTIGIYTLYISATTGNSAAATASSTFTEDSSGGGGGGGSWFGSLMNSISSILPTILPIAPPATTTTIATSTPVVATSTPEAPTCASASMLSKEVQAVLSFIQSFGVGGSLITRAQSALCGIQNVPPAPAPIPVPVQLPSTPVSTPAATAPPAPAASAPASSATLSASGTFTENLQKGDSGPAVLALQQFLNTHGYVIAAVGPNSPGNETGTYDALTYGAVMRFQQENRAAVLAPEGLLYGNGILDASTRAYINSLLAQ